jgi:hypothetical protein
MADGRRGRVVSGTITVDKLGIRLAPQRLRADGPPAVGVTWDEVVGLRAYLVPGKINVGNLELDLQHGTHIRFQVSGYTRLAKVLGGLSGESQHDPA